MSFKSYKKSQKVLFGFLIVFILFIFFTPFLINWAYLKGANTAFTASDMVVLYGAIVSFIGTLALGIIAIWQNKRAYDLNERITKLEEERFKHEYQPFVLVTNWEAKVENIIDIITTPRKLYIDIGHTTNDTSDYLTLSFILTNTSNSFTLVNYQTAEIFNNEQLIDKWGYGIANNKNPKLYIQCGDNGEITFYSTVERIRSYIGNTIRLGLILENRFGKRYKETVDIIVLGLQMLGDTWHLQIFPQNYKIFEC